jgi:hypothetical protein
MYEDPRKNRMRPKDNPFASHRVESIEFCFLNGSREQLIASVERPGFRGAIVGPKGHGKTTLLGELECSLRKLGYTVRLLRFSENRSCSPIPPARPGEMILLDGAEQLQSLEWLAFRWRMRHARALVITTHCKGRLPTLYRCETTPELLVLLTARLLGDTRRGVDDQDLFELFEKYRGDIREVLRELYDACANPRAAGVPGSRLRAPDI